MFLDPAAQEAVKRRVAALESATGVEAVAAVVARADCYPEIPWKAFALGAALAALAAVAAALFEPGWEAHEAVWEAAVAVLAAGASAALATVWIAPFARLFLPRTRREAEALQYAQAMFLEEGLHRTRRSDGVLLLVALFEREVVVLADRGVREKLGAAGLDAVVSAVSARLKQGRLEAGLLEGLARLEEALLACGFRPRPGEADELPNELIERKGAS
ncbi:MAG TPA: TPM domain-containing protein [Burkholderiales bacterium]|nr:TPM domain-containing protein [Burkholderiales bacterium]